ncbi:LytTR family DNA-binding domain-containing protein [uncultured Bacteroides sp.]|uniref:LytR/AlgR family response regulator transcription factor n=1 Tax=uncultured Bacteroides sp. TaxID=162156 RepID=UPI002AAC2A34|nr:LytTR family DNA-binding domain-containing protein [uncultured Bacteroides sp.]
MNIVIIEDEKITAAELAGTICELESDANIVAILASVKTAIAYFESNPVPDLIFSDVQLGDGLSFEIFKAIQISVPVIFCTAYDEYALNAFKTNGIDYVLKPSTSQTIADSLAKYRSLQKTFSGKKEQRYDAILDLLANREVPKNTSVLVYHKDKIMPVRLEEIAFFYIANEVTCLLTFNSEKYQINKKFEELEQIAGRNFFRVNRQYLVNRKAVLDVSRYFLRKLSVNISIPHKEKILVSKEKTPQFLHWLETQS